MNRNDRVKVTFSCTLGSSYDVVGFREYIKSLLDRGHAIDDVTFDDGIEVLCPPEPAFMSAVVDADGFIWQHVSKGMFHPIVQVGPGPESKLCGAYKPKPWHLLWEDHGPCKPVRFS